MDEWTADKARTDEWTANEAGTDEWTADKAGMDEAAVESHTAVGALRGGGAGQEPKQANAGEYTRQVHNAPRAGLFGHVSDIRQGQQAVRSATLHPTRDGQEPDDCHLPRPED
jgi:hypothetical protein